MTFRSLITFDTTHVVLPLVPMSLIMRGLLSIFLSIFLYVPLLAQHGEESWRLPMKDHKVLFTQSRAVPTRYHELCEYFSADPFQDDFIKSLDGISRNLSRSTHWKGNTTCSYDLQMSYGRLQNPIKISNCSPEEIDTIFGRLSCHVDWISNVITNDKNATENITVDFLITIVFMNTQDAYMSLEGVSFKKEEFHPSLNWRKKKDIRLEEAYLKFSEASKKDKKDMQLFALIKDMAQSFISTVYDNLVKEVKYDEQ